MNDHDPNDRGFDLEPYFAAARRSAPEPDDALMGRILADAHAARAVRNPPVARRMDVIALIYRLLGGWSGLGGLASAALAGVWIGIAVPEPVAAHLSGVLGGYPEVSLWPDDLYAIVEESEES